MRTQVDSAEGIHALMAGFLLFLSVSVPLTAQTIAGSTYHIARDITLGGDGRWDYVVVDTAGHRLFIARQTRIMVVEPGE